MSKILVVDFDDSLITGQSHEIFFSCLDLNFFERLTKYIFSKIFGRFYISLFINTLIILNRINLDKIYYTYNKEILLRFNKKVLNKIDEYKNAKIILITASFDFLTSSVLNKIKFDKIICSETFYFLNKRFVAFNRCYGKNKVLKLYEYIGKNNSSEIISITDDISDLPLINISEKFVMVNVKDKNQEKLKKLANEII